ncbi:MAG: T9SS type A sorting domain-containing protein [candidate division WOR-3 bacterium]|nr:MAG: T9SS type A sorting domain-containing protein [candidate division WOR-3 bacterium]
MPQATLLLLLSVVQGWQSYTNARFNNDLLWFDSTLTVATNGGVVQVNTSALTEERILVNTDGLPSNRCQVVASDKARNIWVGTDAGLAVVPSDSGKPIRYRSSTNEPPGDASVVALAFDGDRLLVGTDGIGLYVIETQGTFLDFDDDVVVHITDTQEPSLLSNWIRSVLVHDEYWIGTIRGAVAVDKGLGSWRPYLRPGGGDSVKAMSVWNDSLIIATERGLALYRDTTFISVFEFGRQRKSYDLAVAGRDVYLATDTGIYRGVLTPEPLFELIYLSDVRALQVGSLIWAGLGGGETYGYGLRYSSTGQTWSSFYPTGIPSAEVSSCDFSPVTHNLHACHFMTYWGFREVTEILPAERRVQTARGVIINPIQLVCDSRGRVWFAHFADNGGVSMYDPEADTWAMVKWGGSSARNTIDAFGVDRWDTKWVFNAAGEIIAIDSLGQQMEFDVPGLVPPPGGGFDFAFDSQGRVWLGLTVGLVRLDYGGTLFDPSDDSDTVYAAELPSAEVRSVAVDAADRVWVATPQGAAVFEGGRFRRITAGPGGLQSNNVLRVRVDGAGRAWFLCDRVLSILDPVSGWTHHQPGPGGLIPNTQGVAGFYTSLAIDDETGTAAIGTLRGISLYSFGGDTLPDDAGRLLIYPNPCILKDGREVGVVIDSLPEKAKVEIRTLSGRLIEEVTVTEGLRRAVWFPRDVASGLYLVVVKNSHGAKVERVAVVRP